MNPLKITCTSSTDKHYNRVSSNLRDFESHEGKEDTSLLYHFTEIKPHLNDCSSLQSLLGKMPLRLILSTSEYSFVFPSWESLSQYLDTSPVLQKNVVLDVGYKGNSVSAGVIRGIDEIEDAVERHIAAKQWSKEANPVKKQNLKNFSGSSKESLSAVPPVALFALGAAMKDGENKYEKFNWRDSETTASVFYNAMMRHLADWYNGEDFADDSKIHHLAHLMAGCAIVLDSIDSKVFIDDRKGSGKSASRTAGLWKSTS